MADKPEKLNERYTLWEKIASGGMADVYRATEYGAKGSSKTVALKKILSSFSSNPDYKKMFIDEGIIGSQLTHANICQVNPLIEIDDNLYIPMEFIEGKNLRQVINKFKKKNGSKPLPVPFSLFVINEVFKGLDYAHSAQSKFGGDSGKPLNIVHRDMSPQNIMLSYQGGIKLIDFGIAKAKILTNETRAGVIKGKYSYMSPEQALGQSLGPQSDIFSAGIVFWEMLTGERLFQSDNDMATLKSIQDCDLQNLDPIKKNPEVTSELNKIVMKALTKDLSLRYRSADVIQQHIQRYINEKYGSYTSKNVRRFLEELFADEILAEHKKAQELYGTTLSNSQRKGSSNKNDISGIELALDGSVTSTELSQSIGVTQTDAKEARESFDSESGAEKDSIREAEPTLLEVSQKSAVSLEHENFKIPTLLGDPKSPANSDEHSVTKAASVGDSGIRLELPPEVVDKLEDELKERSVPSQASGTLPSLTAGSGTVGKTGSLSNQDLKSRTSSTGSFKVDVEKTGSNIRDLSDLKEEEQHEESEPMPQSKENQRWVAYGAVILVFAVVYIYKLIFEVNIFSSPTRPPANLSRPESIFSQGNRSASVNKLLCEIQVETDPPGANLIGDNFRGTSSTGSILAPCDKAVVLRIEKPGYEPFKITVDTTKKAKQVLPRVNLLPIQEGSIVLTVDNNATVEIDGRLVGEIMANTPTEFRLTPGIRKFVFKNEVLKFQAAKEFQILDKQKKVEAETIKMNDVKP